MNMPLKITSGVIAPSDGDIYYYETMAELDAHEVEGDQRRAKLARLGNKLVGYCLIALIIGAAIIFRATLVLQIGAVLAACSLAVGWSLYRLLELCDD